MTLTSYHDDVKIQKKKKKYFHYTLGIHFDIDVPEKPPQESVGVFITSFRLRYSDFVKTHLLIHSTEMSFLHSYLLCIPLPSAGAALAVFFSLHLKSIFPSALFRGTAATEITSCPRIKIVFLRTPDCQTRAQLVRIFFTVFTEIICSDAIIVFYTVKQMQRGSFCSYLNW